MNYQTCAARGSLASFGRKWPTEWGGPQVHLPAPTDNHEYLHATLEQYHGFDIPEDRVALLRRGTADMVTRLYPYIGGGHKPIQTAVELDTRLLFALSGSDRSAGQPASHLLGYKTKGEIVDDASSRKIVVDACMSVVDSQYDGAHVDYLRAKLGCDYQETVLGAPKTELRTEERVKAGKSRLFMPADMFSYAMLEAFFGGISRRLHSCWQYGPAWIRVGISSAHGNFNRMMSRHARRQFSVAGDFSRFDSSINRTLMECVATALSEFMDRTWRWVAIGVFFRWVVDLLVAMFDGTLWRKRCGLASGTLITSDVGSIAHGVGFHYVVYRCVQTFAPSKLAEVDGAWLDEYFDMSIYSDDSLISFDECPEFGITRENFCVANITAWYAEIGLTWTSEHEFAAFGEHCDFLGRIPVKAGNGQYVPKCKNPGKVVGGLLWSKNSGPKLESQFDAALIEFAFSDSWWQYTWHWAEACGFRLRDQAHYQRIFQDIETHPYIVAQTRRAEDEPILADDPFGLTADTAPFGAMPTTFDGLAAVFNADAFIPPPYVPTPAEQAALALMVARNKRRQWWAERLERFLSFDLAWAIACLIDGDYRFVRRITDDGAYVKLMVFLWLLTFGLWLSDAPGVLLMSCTTLMMGGIVYDVVTNSCGGRPVIVAQSKRLSADAPVYVPKTAFRPEGRDNADAEFNSLVLDAAVLPRLEYGFVVCSGCGLVLRVVGPFHKTAACEDCFADWQWFDWVQRRSRQLADGQQKKWKQFLQSQTLDQTVRHFAVRRAPAPGGR